jgi:hypothetical protein
MENLVELVFENLGIGIEAGMHTIAFDQRAVIYPSPDHHSETLLAKMARRVRCLAATYAAGDSATPLTMSVEKPSPIVCDVQKRRRSWVLHLAAPRLMVYAIDCEEIRP